MTIHSDSRIILAPADRIFDMVADVEAYPDFLPMWRDARIYERRMNIYWTEQTVGIGPVREHFRTKTTLRKPLRIEIVSTDDLFTNFFISWDFHPVGRGCRASIAMTWEMRSQKVQRAIDLLLSHAAHSMVVAFEKRARQLRLS
jgi:coenzyme Q-binding protein COQ10